MLRTIITISGLAVLICACGETRLDRGLSGGAIGAGLGAVASAATDGEVVRGFVLGAAVGAAVGVLTDKEQIDLGEPVWRRAPKPLFPAAEGGVGPS